MHHFKHVFFIINQQNRFIARWYTGIGGCIRHGFGFPMGQRQINAHCRPPTRLTINVDNPVIALDDFIYHAEARSFTFILVVDTIVRIENMLYLIRFNTMACIFNRQLQVGSGTQIHIGGYIAGIYNYLREGYLQYTAFFFHGLVCIGAKVH